MYIKKYKLYFLIVLVFTFFFLKGGVKEGRLDKNIQDEIALESEIFEEIKSLNEDEEEVERLPSSSSNVKNEKLNLRILRTKAFKKYREINLKVISSLKDKLIKNKILRSKALLNAASNVILSEKRTYSHGLEVAHLEVSAFLIEAFKLDSKVAMKSLSKILEVNLSEKKLTMSEKSYNLLKEDKAEIMYEALAVNENLTRSYTPDVKDSESQEIYDNVLKRHELNKSISKRMISQR